MPDPAPEEFAAWLPPERAFGKLVAGLPAVLFPVLLTRLRAGRVIAAADGASCDEAEPRTRRLITIDRNWWLKVPAGFSFMHPLWSYGDITLMLPDGEGFNVPVNFFDLRFEPRGLREIVPEPRNMLAEAVRAARARPLAPVHIDHRLGNPLQQEEPVTPAPGGPTWTDLHKPELKRIAALEAALAGQVAKETHGGGRPLKPFWEDMWIALVRRMYVEGIPHDRLAAIEDVMHQWLADNGHEAGVSAVRDRARKLLAALRKEG